MGQQVGLSAGFGPEKRPSEAAVGRVGSGEMKRKQKEQTIVVLKCYSIPKSKSRKTGKVEPLLASMLL
jgi:hypothetical protein